MSNALFGKGRNAFLTGSVNFGNDTIMSMLVDLSSSFGVASQVIISGTNGSPMTLKTGQNHGFSNGDICVVGNVGGLTCANNTWKIAGVSANTVQLTTKVDGVNSTGNAVNGAGQVYYTSGGWIVNLTLAGIMPDLSGTRTGTDVALTGKTAALGVANSSAWTHTSVTGNIVNSVVAPVQAFVLYRSGTVAGQGNGSFNDSYPLAFYDGKTQIYVDSGSLQSTQPNIVTVTPLIAAIPTATVVFFSNGSSGSLSAPASVGDRVLTFAAAPSPVNPPPGTTADCTTTSAGLPVTPNGGNITITPDAGVNKLFAL